jgi:hypothetical protein
MGVRDEVWDALAHDSVLNSLGITSDNLYPGLMTPDSPPQDLFVVLRWGVTDRGPGRNAGSVENLSVWAYNRQTDYGPILDVLSRCRTVLLGIRGPGAIIQVDYRGDSEDLWDDGYRAVTRNSTYQIPNGG